MDKKTFKKLAKASAPPSPIGMDCVRAFLCGGTICLFAQLLNALCVALGASTKDAGTIATVTLVFIAILLTGIGVFDRIAKFAGAGTLVPITGFANAVAAPALDSRTEGLILGVGVKIFTVAGPVILYGCAAGTIYGVVLWIMTLLGYNPEVGIWAAS